MNNPWNPSTHPIEYDLWHSTHPHSLADDPAAVERAAQVFYRSTVDIGLYNEPWTE